MPKPPTIDRSVVNPIAGVIGEITGRVEELLDESGLSRLWEDTSVVEFPEDRVWKLFERAASKCDCPSIGLHAGERIQINDLGPLGRQLQNSLTLFQCLNRYNKTVSRYSSHASFWLEQQGDAYWFCRQGIDLISAGRDYVEQFTLQLMIRIVRLAAGPEWSPTALRIQAPSDQTYRAVPEFQDANIRTSRPATSIRIPLVLGSVSIFDSVDSGLASQIQELFAAGENCYRMGIDEIANDLGTSRRTLQRRLTDCGLEWSRLVEQYRFRKAIKMLADSDVQLIHLSHELGYTDQANFGRAFRKWTGMSPGTYRKLRRGRDG